MSIGEFFKLRNAIFFLLKSKPTHKSKSTDKTWFYSETFDLCKWAFPIF